MKSAGMLFLAWLIPCLCFAAERDYQQYWCSEYGGTVQVELPAGTHVDCLTATHAVEVEPAGAWADALGRALDHARVTGKRAGVVLIVENTLDHTCLSRLRAVTEHYGLPVDVWTVR